MDDKEVGELWRRLNEDCGKRDACDNHGDMFALIRKLVEERADRYGVMVVDVLADFDIPQESWNDGRND